MDIAGSSAIVTGAGSGLGAATARRLSHAGAKVVVIDLQEDAGEAVAKDIGGAFVRADVRSESDVQQAVDVATEMGPLRVLVNCAGIVFAKRTVGRDGAHDLESFERVIGINLVGTFNCIRLAAAVMSRTEPFEDGARGAIVNTSSVAAFDGQIGQAAYSASKGGIVGMTLPLARDLALVGIRVNAIAPGLVQTPIYQALGNPEAVMEALGRDVQFPKRFGRPEEFASLALELITNDYMNGEVVRIDGAARLQPK